MMLTRALVRLSDIPVVQKDFVSLLNNFPRAIEAERTHELSERDATANALIDLETVGSSPGESLLAKSSEDLLDTGSVVTGVESTGTSLARLARLDLGGDPLFEHDGAIVVAVVRLLLVTPDDTVSDGTGSGPLLAFRFDVGTANELGSEGVVVGVGVSDGGLHARGSGTKVGLVCSRKKR